VGDPVLSLALAVVVAAVYVAVLRLIDLNEREPLWALALVLFAGALAGLVLPLLVSTARMAFEPLTGAVAQEAAKFVALAAALGVLGLVGRLRGFSEVNGPGDGLLYGAAVGLGFAVGDTLARDLGAGGQALVAPGAFGLVWTTALFGLAQGVFSAVAGLGFGAAVGARGASRLLWPVAGLVGAVLVHWGFEALRGDALSGSASLARTWLALLAPVALVAVAAVVALGRERRAIGQELEAEVASGAVTREELRLLGSPAARRSEYARRFLGGDFDGWLALRGLHNRQVQLALAKRRGDVGEAEALRAAIDAARAALRAASGPGPARAG
jgi:hypothetical protein